MAQDWDSDLTPLGDSGNNNWDSGLIPVAPAQNAQAQPMPANNTAKPLPMTPDIEQQYGEELAIQRAGDRALADQPGTTYGGLLPYSKNQKTGELSWATPEAIRSPIRGAQDLQTMAATQSTQMTPDSVNAALAMLGPALGAEGAAGPRGMPPAPPGGGGGGPGFSIGGVKSLLKDTSGLAGITSDELKPKPFDPMAAHSAISDSYAAAKSQAGKYYDFMRSMGENKVVPATGLQDDLGNIITDIQNTPFHEGAPALNKLKSIQAKISGGTEAPTILDQYGNPLKTQIPDSVQVNDLVDLKQLLNNQFNPKRFTQAADTPYVGLSNTVDNALESASTIYPEFGEANELAKKNWVNNVALPFQNNKVLSKFWKPEDYFAQQNIDSGLAERLPDETQQRAAAMIPNIKNRVQFNALRRVLPSNVADALGQAKLQHITQGEGTGRLASTGHLISGSLDLTPSGVANSLRNVAGVIKPRFGPDQMTMINEINSPAPTLSPQYEPQFQALKAKAVQPNVSVTP